MIKKKITAIKDRDPLTEKIIGCAYAVHRQLGPGFNENIYHNALEIALKEEGESSLFLKRIYPKEPYLRF